VTLDLGSLSFESSRGGAKRIRESTKKVQIERGRPSAINNAAMSAKDKNIMEKTE